MELEAPRRVTRHLTFDATPGSAKNVKANEQSTVSSSINVYLRIRPFSDGERRNNIASCVLPQTKERVLYIRPNKPDKHPPAIRHAGHAVFRFASVFDERVTQETVFERTTLPLISHLFRGESAVLFAYGVTCSGKTFTIQGTAEMPGILPRTLDVIINSIAIAKGNGLAQESAISDEVAELTDDQLMHRRRLRSRLPSRKTGTHDAHFVDVDPSAEYSIYASFLEIYNDQVYDLFDKTAVTPLVDETITSEGGSALYTAGGIPNAFASAPIEVEQYSFDTASSDVRPSRPRRPALKLKERVCPDASAKGEKEVYADGQREVRVRSVVDIERLLEFGCNNRTVAHTRSNTSSSRSHAIFVITLKQEINVPGENGVKRMRTTSRLQIVDLAGSEKVSKADISVNRVQESRQINTSLMNLSRCLEQLRKNQRLNAAGASLKTRIVPFRDSKLTRLLQRGLSTGSAVMIATMSPSLDDADETIHTLRNTAIAREVKVKAVPARHVFTDVTNPKNLESASIDGRQHSSRKVALGHKKRLDPKSRVLKPRAADADNVPLGGGHTQEFSIVKDKLIKTHEQLEITLEREAALRKRTEKLESIARLAEDALLESDQEREKLYRDNERLREKLAHVEGKVQSLEYELRAEIGDQMGGIVKKLMEKYEKQIQGLRDRSYGRFIAGDVEKAKKRLMRSSTAAFASIASEVQANDDDDEDIFMEGDELLYED